MRSPAVRRMVKRLTKVEPFSNHAPVPLFSFITQNWRGKPLYDLVTVISLISNTTTSKGLLVKSSVDTTIYEKGIEVSDAELANVKRKPHNFHGEWNYTKKK